MTAKLEHTQLGQGDGVANAWRGDNHPFPGVTDGKTTGLSRVESAPLEQQNGQMDVPSLKVASVMPERPSLEVPPAFNGPLPAAQEVPAPIQQAIASGAPIRFSAPGENQQASRQPDYYFTPEGQLIPNPNAKPSPDGSINIEIQNRDRAANQSLRDAITHETDMQKQAAKEMIRLFQKSHPGQPVPSWMEDLMNAKPNLPDFVPFTPSPSAPASAPPENGFVPRGVGGHGSGGGSRGGSGGGDGGFAGNGGFDNQGYFKGNGGSGDGTLSTGGTNSHGQPLGPGEQVKAKEIYDYLTQHYGLSPVMASGILGNMQTESSFKTNAYNHGEGAIGLAQWEGGRRTQLENFAAQQGKPVTDWHVQVDFMMKELQGPEKNAWNALQAAHNPAEAARAFDKYYERSAGTSREQRAANATNIYQQLA